MPLQRELIAHSRKRAPIRSNLIALVLAASVLLLGAPSAHADADSTHTLLIGLESYIDDATDRTELSLGMLQNDQDETEVGRGLVSGSISLSYLLGLTSNFRFGGGARYFGSYRFEEDEQDDDEAEGILIGRLFEFYARAEYLLGLDSELHLVPAIEVGMPMLFPSGTLQTELDELETTGYSVNSLPRIGYFFGGELGARYQLESWFALRGGLGVFYEKLILYDATTDDNVGERSRTFSLMRLRLGLNAELNF